MKSKKFLSILPAVALCLSLLPGAALAEDTGADSLILDSERSTIETSAMPISLMSLDDEGKVPLKNSNAVNWIDRLDLSGEDYARPFYDWLVENSDGDGVDDALIDPAMGESINMGGEQLYYHTITQFSGAADFTFDSNGSDAEIAKAAEKALLSATKDQTDTICAYTYEVSHAFDRDHPEVFWLSTSSRVTNLYSYSYWYEDIDDGVGSVTYDLTVCFILHYGSFDVRAREYDDAEDILETIAERDAAVDAILDGMDPNASRYEQIRYLNNWLTTRNCYNTSRSLKGIDTDCYECISALTGSVGSDGPVCEGYARAFNLLCDRLGIPCILVDGSANGGPHMWNYVQMEDSNWYAVDVTWNDPSVSGVSYALSGHENENYLLVGGDTEISGETFLCSHPVSNRPSSLQSTPCYLNGPVLSQTAYDPAAAVAHTHSYGDPVFVWAEDYSSCTASITCPNCGETEEGHTLSAECAVTSSKGDSGMTFTAAATLNGREVSAEARIAARISGDEVTITLPQTPGHMTVIIVDYDAGGRMTRCQLFTAPEDVIRATISGSSVMVFFLSDDAIPCPLLSALQVR